MEDDAFKKLLAWAYRGEVSGDVLFSDLATAFPEHGEKLEILAVLEQKMATALRPLLTEYRVDGGDDGQSRQKGHDSASAVASGDWRSLLELFEPVTAEAIGRYKKLAALMPDASQTNLMELLIDHEEALAAFARSELDASDEGSTDPVRRVISRLDHHITPAKT